ncbi:MAG: carboxypeptidase-like regulatory domain-containing protein [Capsulimonadaceae bacterium]|nr:carboxypeptidase-like regulatory domain-containing protein [Capsulimonadaceae bacterium]
MFQKLLKPFIVVAAGAVVVALMLFAAQAYLIYSYHPDHRRLGVVLNGLQKPMPGAILRFRDQRGTVVALFTANRDGEFRGNRLDGVRSGLHADGYGLYRSTGDTGGAGFIYYFSPIGKQIVCVRDPSRHPLAKLKLVLGGHDAHGRELRITTAADGCGQVRAPLAARYDLSCSNPNWEIGHVNVTARAGFVRYDAMAVRPAAIRGRLHGPDGKPVAGGTIVSERYAGGDFIAFGPSAIVDGQGRFLIAHLKPAEYQLVWQSNQPSRLAPQELCAHPVLTASGKTTTVGLRCR